MRPANSLLGPNASGPRKWASSVVFNERQHQEVQRLQMLNAHLMQAQAQAPRPSPPAAASPSPAPAAVAEASRTGAAVDGLLSLLGAAEGNASAAAEERMQPTGALARLAAMVH